MEKDKTEHEWKLERLNGENIPERKKVEEKVGLLLSIREDESFLMVSPVMFNQSHYKLSKLSSRALLRSSTVNL